MILINKRRGLKTLSAVVFLILVGFVAIGCGKKILTKCASESCATESTETVPLIPRETIFGNPERSGPQLSPDGSMFAYLAPDEGVMNVWVKTVGKEDDHTVTADRNRGIMGYFWAPNGSQILYVQDRDGDENWHVYSVPAIGGEPLNLTPIEGVRASIVSVDPEFPDEILVGLNDRIPQFHDIYRINLGTGERTLEVQNDIGAAGWIADHEFKVRIAQVPTPEGGYKLLHRTSSDAEWAELLSWGGDDALSTGAFGFARDNQTLFMINSVGSNTAELRTYHVPTGTEEVIASDPNYDIGGLMIQPRTYKLQAVAYVKDRMEWHALEPGFEQHLDNLKSLHHGDYYITNRDRQDDNWLVRFTQDTGPVVYYKYNREKGEGTFLFSSRPKLMDQPLAKMKPVTFDARDEINIHGYLTLPVGSDGKNLPTVINVHGGPWARDSWGYNPEVQWLANRGYAVFQINFRGSSGYGKDFTNAGDREWGGKMQDDITDGTKWLIDQGVADPEKIAIYGGSYGGYAVLAGVTKTPDLYTCGIDLFGPSNLITFLNTIPPYWESFRIVMYQRIGHPEEDIDFLKSRSPLFQVDKIQVPMLIVQGANDPRVKKEESIQIRDALLNAGKQVEYMEFPDEGHGFARPENRIKYYSAAEKFLAEHLGGRFEE